MNRTNTIHLNDRELKLLQEIRATELDDETAPLGEAVKVASENHLNENRRFANNFTERSK